MVSGARDRTGGGTAPTAENNIPDRVHIPVVAASSHTDRPVAITGPDTIIIADEIDELENIDDEVADRKEQVVLRAADKLAGKYHDDMSVVASRLANILARDRTVAGRMVHARVSRSWLYEVLPVKYKRGNQMIHTSTPAAPALTDTYAPDDIDMSSSSSSSPPPESALADFCDELNAAAQQTAALCQIMAREARTLYETEPALHDMIESDGGQSVLKGHDIMLRKLSAGGHFSKLMPLVRDISDTAESAKSLLDRRQRFGTAARMGLQVAFLTHSYAEMAARISGHKYGGKWMAHIDDDDETRKFAQVYRCPACGLDSQLYIEKYKRAYERGDANMPEIHEFCEGVRGKMGKKKK